MPLSRAERKLISLGNKELHDRLTFNRDIQRDLTARNVRRGMIGDKYRQRLLEKAFASAGIDYSLILRRQEKEGDSVRKEVLALKKKFQANTVKVDQRHTQLIERFKKVNPFSPGIHRNPAPAEKDVSLGYLAAPTTFNLQDMGTPKNATLTVVQQSALLKFKWDTKVVDLWNPSITATANYLWTPPKDGTLGIFSMAAYNGTGSWATYGTCGYPPWLAIFFSSVIAVQQMDSFGQPITETATATGGIHDSHEGGCFPHSGHKAYDQVDYLQLNSPFLVQKRMPVMITITISGDCFGLSVAGELDFQTGSSAITLPGVLLGFAPS